MRESTSVEVEKRLTRFGAHFTLVTAIVAAVSGCGGNSKDPTGQTHDRPSDAAVDGGSKAEPEDASLFDASMDTTLADDAATMGSSGQQESATTVSSTLTSTSVSTSAPMDTSRTMPDTAGELRPGWVAVEPVADGLSNCSARLDRSDGLCVYSVLCGTVELGSRCELRDDAWQCTCQLSASPERTYTLTGEPESSACELSLELCSPTRPPDPTPVCETELESLSDVGCAASERCRTPAELNEGVDVEILESGAGTTCAKDSVDGTTVCQCRDSGASAVLFEVPLEQACTSLVPLCKTGFPSAEATATFACSAGLSSQGEDFCQIERMCGPKMDFEGGYAILDASSQRVECSGSSGCECSGTDFVAARASGELDAGQCDVMAEFCQGEVTVVPTGPVSISSIETQGSDRVCTGSAIARQWATWTNEKSVELEGLVLTECVRGDANAWTCSCDSGKNRTASFEAQGLDFDDACGGALEHCMARIHFVPTNASDYSDGASLVFVSDPAEADAGL